LWLPPGRAATTGLILELPGITTKIQGVNLASLTTLVREYESQHHPYEVDDDWPVHERIEHMIDMADMTASDLGELLGNRSLGSKLVRGEREPSKTHIRILADRFKVSPAFFL
jgi:HTH-type transcriptional regulator/antitoxin HigA